MSYSLIHLHKQSVTSTNTAIEEYFSLIDDKTMVALTADLQTKGMSPKQTRWLSQEKDLTLSIAFLAKSKHHKLYIQSAALTLIQVLQTLDIAARIKWPNDLLVNHGKIAGIMLKRQKEISILGVGLNIFHNPKHADLPYAATSIQDEIPHILLNDHQWIHDFTHTVVKAVQESIERAENAPNDIINLSAKKH